ncbi:MULTISPECIES: hypothetical protein [Arthrobacter]|uniref:hypothetical protein n=1 Tax=Arthrobacter TaxID=1663 RepID=UPI000B0F549F
MAEVEIHPWWLELDLPVKQWLRENVRADEVPEPGVAAGGAVVGGMLTAREWDFITTLSEFVD